MQDTETITIIHLYRNNGSSLFLHPLKEKSNILKKLENHRLVGLYGHEPRIESITLFRNELYRIVEKEVRDWVSDAKFIPRFLIAAAAFLLSYLFMSFIIRDPIPVLDELAISLGISIFIYIFMGKRDLKSDLALKKRISLRNRVDTIKFNENELIREMEEKLHEYEGMKRSELVEELISLNPEDFPSEQKMEAKKLLSYLEKHFDSSEYKRFTKKLEKYYQGKLNERDLSGIRRWANLRRVDLPLYVLYTQLRLSVKKG